MHESVVTRLTPVLASLPVSIDSEDWTRRKDAYNQESGRSMLQDAIAFGLFEVCPEAMVGRLTRRINRRIHREKDLVTRVRRPLTND